MIKEIPLTQAKGQLRFEGIALTKAETAAIIKINEIVRKLNEMP